MGNELADLVGIQLAILAPLGEVQQDVGSSDSLTNILDPSVVVVGGGVIDAWEVLHPAFLRWMNEVLYSPDHRPHPQLRPAELGPRAGAIGSALLSLS